MCKTRLQARLNKKIFKEFERICDFSCVEKKELKHDIENKRLILLQQKLIKWSGKYKKASGKRFFQRQMEDYAVFINEKQIKQYKESSYYLEPIELFNKFQEGVQNVKKQQFCLLRDFLIVLIELACAHRSGVCANFALKEFQKKTYKAPYHMFFVENYKTFPTSGHAVVTLTDDEFKYLQIYVKDLHPQVSPKDNTVFVSWSGRSMASSAISRQISSIWKKLGITESGDKNVSSNIIRKNASTEIWEKKDPRTAETADLMVHSEKTAASHYCVRKKQLNAAAGSTALRKVFEKTESTALSP